MSMCLHFNFAWNYARISDNNTSFSLSSFLPKHKQQFRYAKMFPASFRAWPKPLPFVLQPQPNQNPASSSTLKWDEYNFWLFLLFYCWQSTEWLVYVRVCCLSMQYIAKVCLKEKMDHTFRYDSNRTKITWITQQDLSCWNWPTGYPMHNTAHCVCVQLFFLSFSHVFIFLLTDDWTNIKKYHRSTLRECKKK